MTEHLRRFTRMRTLCEGALELCPAERIPWLVRMCEDDAELLGEVQDLLLRVDQDGAVADFLRGIDGGIG